MTRCNGRPYSRGGFGDVHQGTLLDGTKVALKCLRLYVNESESNDKVLKYAARELHTWSRCRHPNIVQLLGLAEFHDQIAMISPWMENGSVDRLNRNNNKIDRCRLCFEVARGLAYLHEINIVHGDLKGRNVLLSSNGEALLADFGNAVLVGGALLFTESTSARSGFSMRWAAPEQLLNEVAYSRQADVYSLGMTVLEIISRQLPYAEAKNEAAVMMTVLKLKHPRRPDKIPVESKQGNTLWALLKTCWSRDPEDRPEASYVASVIEMTKSEDLLVELPETSTGLSLPGSAQSSCVAETDRKQKTKEGQELQKKRPRSNTDEQMHISITHQHLISRATELLNHISPRKRQRLNNSPAEPTSEPKHGVNDVTCLLSEMRKLGIEASERAGLESLDQQVRDFQQKARGQLHKFGDSEDTALLAKFEELVAIGTSLHLRLDEMVELERLITRLQFFHGLRALNDSNPTLDQVEELISRGLAGGVSPDRQVMVELTRKATSGRLREGRALLILTQRSATKEDLDQLVASAEEVPSLPGILDKIENTLAKRREHEKMVWECLNPSRRGGVSVNDAVELATATLEVMLLPAAEEFHALSTEAQMREQMCANILTGRFQPRGNETVFDELRAMRAEDKSRFWRFRMPWSEEAIYQLAMHNDWISHLPWTRLGLSPLDLDSIVQDVTGNGDSECASPTNEACTCICLEPVAAVQSTQHDEVAQCDHCLASFHAKCVEGWCPFCDDRTWNRLMGEPPTFKPQHLYYQHENACELTEHYSPEFRALEVIRFYKGDYALAKPIVKFIKRLSQQRSPDPTAVPQIRHLIRRLYRIQVEISLRPEIFAYGLSLAHLHRRMTMRSRIKQLKPQKPKFVFMAEMDPEGLDGSRCLCGWDGWDGWDYLPTGCSKCKSVYHRKCIALSSTDQTPNPFVCPLCLLREGKSYEPAEVRVTYQDDDPEENAKYVDVKACLDSYSWRVIRHALPPPVRPTIIVELFLFVPGTGPNIEEPEPRSNSYRETSTGPWQHANKGSNNNEGFSSRGDSSYR
ncbi:hypothetical protein FRC09_016814 [Ceratobasidium sp. 395]|nr:hypothetical protein FRC09_016814 [Ceratobasidium sp. 395]